MHSTSIKQLCLSILLIIEVNKWIKVIGNELLRK